MSATAGLKEALYGLAVHYSTTEPDPGVLALISDGSNIAGATLGAWLAVAVGAGTIVAMKAPRAPRWYAGLSAIVAGHAGGLRTGLHTRTTGTVADLYMAAANKAMGLNLTKFPSGSRELPEIYG